MGILTRNTDELTPSTWNDSPTSTSEPTNRFRLSIFSKPCTKVIPGISELCIPYSWRSSSNLLSQLNVPSRSTSEPTSTATSTSTFTSKASQSRPTPILRPRRPLWIVFGKRVSGGTEYKVHWNNGKYSVRCSFRVVRPFHGCFLDSRPLRKHCSCKVAQAELDPLRAMLTSKSPSGSHTTACTTTIRLSSTII